MTQVCKNLGDCVFISKWPLLGSDVQTVVFFCFFFPTDLSVAVQKFSQSLQEFQFECIGDAETDDEVNIGKPQPVPLLFTPLFAVFHFIHLSPSRGKK